MPGNISDVATLKTTIKSLDYLGADSMQLVLDRGFYSSSNIDELYLHKHKFTIAAPAGRKWVEQIIDKHYECIAAPQNYLTVKEDEALYAATELYRWGAKKHRLYLHVYYNAEQAAANFDAFTRKLIALKNELETGKKIKKHEELYERYFNIKETPKRGQKIEFNNAEIQKQRKRYSGFFCIMSNKIKSAEEALRVYRAKDIVENCFDDLKNHLDMKRLRVHNSAAMDSRIFIQFLALIYISAIRETTRKNDKLKYLTVREVMEEMETLTKIKYSNRYGQVFTETTPKQREIMSAFGVAIPS
jgi:transposase